MSNLTPVPTFETVGELEAALRSKAAHEKIDLYPRDGTRALAELETKFAELTRVEDPDNLVLCNTGMSAVVGAVDTFLRAGSTVSFAKQGYSQTLNYIAGLNRLGIATKGFDAEDPKSVESNIRRNHPDIIVSETVGNGADVPVLDLQNLFDVCDEEGYDPIIILDNTLPLATSLDLIKLIDGERKILVVESATKSYAIDPTGLGIQELAGLVYGRNSELVDKVRSQRQTKGFVPGQAIVAYLSENIFPDRASFDERNNRIFRACKFLAAAAFAAQGDGSRIWVSHPCLPTHPNQELAQTTLINGSTPSFAIQCTGDEDQFALTRRIWDSKEVREYAKLGQSFSFDQTRILPNDSAPYVRISAGAETNYQALGCALKRALEL